VRSGRGGPCRPLPRVVSGGYRKEEVSLVRKWLYPALGALIVCAVLVWWASGNERGVRPGGPPAEIASPAAVNGGTAAGPNATVTSETGTSTFGEALKGGRADANPAGPAGGGPRRTGEGQRPAVAGGAAPQGEKPRPDGAGAATAVRVTVEVLGPDGAPLYETREVVLGPGEETPLAALRKTGARVETAFGGRYVAAVDGLREKQYGPTSGWCYRVNGEVPLVGAAEYRLRPGDAVVWFYVRSARESLGRH